MRTDELLAARLAAEDEMHFEDVGDLENIKADRGKYEKSLRRLDHAQHWHQTRAKKNKGVKPGRKKSGGSSPVASENSSGAVVLACSSEMEARIGIDDPQLDAGRPEEYSCVDPLRIWQARDANQHEPNGEP